MKSSQSQNLNHYKPTDTAQNKGTDCTEASSLLTCRVIHVCDWDMLTPTSVLLSLLPKKTLIFSWAVMHLPCNKLFSHYPTTRTWYKQESYVALHKTILKGKPGVLFLPYFLLSGMWTWWLMLRQPPWTIRPCADDDTKVRQVFGSLTLVLIHTSTGLLAARFLLRKRAINF